MSGTFLWDLNKMTRSISYVLSLVFSFQMSTKSLKSTVSASCPDLLSSPYKSTNKKAHVVDLVPFFYILWKHSPKLGSLRAMSGPFLEDLNKSTSEPSMFWSGQTPKYTKDSTLRKYFIVLWLFKTFSLSLHGSNSFLKLFKSSFMEAFSVFLSAISKDSSRASMERCLQPAQNSNRYPAWPDCNACDLSYVVSLL
jgi:hypothetical protein